MSWRRRLGPRSEAGADAGVAVTDTSGVDRCRDETRRVRLPHRADSYGVRVSGRDGGTGLTWASGPDHSRGQGSGVDRHPPGRGRGWRTSRTRRGAAGRDRCGRNETAGGKETEAGEGTDPTRLTTVVGPLRVPQAPCRSHPQVPWGEGSRVT